MTSPTPSIEQIVQSISKSFEDQLNELSNPQIGSRNSYQSLSEASIQSHTELLDNQQKNRVVSEFHGSGPLESLLLEPDLVEIMVNSKSDIWFESKEGLRHFQDCFYSPLTFNNFIHRVCEEAGMQTSLSMPFANGIWRGYRAHLVSPPIVADHILTLRRVRSQALQLDDLQKGGWCSNSELDVLKQIVHDKKNCLVLGNTGSGKTTLLNALVNEAAGDRCVFIEDTSELLAANSASVKLLTRHDSQGRLPDVTQSDLVKQSLRMRPDRLILGETRGAEAKDLLMALATGHKGSMTSLHAHTPQEALLRLEMLIQMGAPQWSLDAIRRLIHLTVECLIVTRKENAKWYLEGIYKISSQEKFGFIVESYCN